MWGEMPGIGNGGMEAVNHVAMSVPMPQSCMICTCTPEPKVQQKQKQNKTKQNYGWEYWFRPIIPEL